MNKNNQWMNCWINEQSTKWINESTHYPDSFWHHRFTSWQISQKSIKSTDNTQENHHKMKNPLTKSNE